MTSIYYTKVLQANQVFKTDADAKSVKILITIGIYAADSYINDDIGTKYWYKIMLIDGHERSNFYNNQNSFSTWIKKWKPHIMGLKLNNLIINIKLCLLIDVSI